MTSTPDAREYQAGLHRLEALLQTTERSADPATLAHTREVVQALLDLHATGLGRILEHVAAADGGTAVIDACAADDVVGGLLLLHGLHPLGIEDRARQALARVRPALRAHDRTIELLGAADGIVRLRLSGGRGTCPSSAAAVRRAVEEAVLAKAPDAVAVEIEGLDDEPAAANGTTRFALPVL